MRKTLLSLMLGLFAVANAQTWTEPEVPTEPSDPVSGRVYRIQNAEEGLCLSYGTVWFSWNTTAMLVDPEASEPLSFTLTEEIADSTNLGWTFKCFDGPWPNRYVFVSGNGIEGFAMHVDNATDVHRYYELLKQENGTYHIRVAAQVDTYGASAVEDWADKCWGWGGYEDATGQNFAVYASVKPEDGFYCDWQFIDLSVYAAKQTLYNLAVAIEEEDLGVDYEAYTAVYESDDLDAINTAAEELKALVAQARAYAVLRYGEDGINPPSSDNPADATELIENSDFSAGNANGWTCTFVGGQNATNVGYQGASYTNGDVQISQFIEAWANAKFNPEVDYRAIGDGELSQTMYGLPAGLYRLTVDCIANNQDGHNPVVGVQLFATGGEAESFKEIATGNGAPEHYEITFVSTGGDVKLGLRTQNTTANWIAADNFTLTYYGEIKDDPNKVILNQRISELEALYGDDIEDLKANKDVKEAYVAVMEYAKATEDYVVALDSLNTAASALAASVNDYKTLNAKIEELDQKSIDLLAQWEDLDIGDLMDEIRAAYDEGTYTAEDIAAIDGKFMDIVGAYISENCKAGDDLTVLLTNPSFDTGNFNGWTKEGTVTDVQGADFQAVNTSGAMADQAEEATTWGKDCETYMATFDLSQTLKNLPAGMYKFTCQGFWRAENANAIPGELYAKLPNGTEQTDNLANVNDYATDEPLYTSGNWYDDKTNDEGKYIPNGMVGALYHFHHYSGDNDFFDYTSTLTIILTEPSDVTVGVRQKGTDAWVIFDNFKMTYMGNDAAVFYDEIQRRIDQAAAVGQGDEDILTAEADDRLAEAITQGQNAQAGGTTDDCIAAINALKDAIAFGEETLKLTAQLKNEYDAMTEYRISEVSSSEETFPAFIDELGVKLTDADFATNAEVEQARFDLKKGFTVYVQHDALDATEDVPADITAVIYNPDYLNYYINEGNFSLAGWTVEGGAGNLATTDEEGNAGFDAEFFNQAYDLRQTIPGLAPGYYRLHVPGYYRNGGYDVVEKALNGELLEDSTGVYTEDKLAVLFAGDAETPLLLISSALDAYNLIEGATGAEITINDSTMLIPNNMAEAELAFANGLYENVLQFEVKEGQEMVEIGLKKEETATNDWTMFGAWKLEYLGTAAPSEDPTTDIKGVETEQTTRIAIYNLAGQRVAKAQKGIYIVNGKKIVVK